MARELQPGENPEATLEDAEELYCWNCDNKATRAVTWKAKYQGVWKRMVTFMCQPCFDAYELGYSIGSEWGDQQDEEETEEEDVN